jgi:hypothetical protein
MWRLAGWEEMWNGVMVLGECFVSERCILYCSESVGRVVCSVVWLAAILRLDRSRTAMPRSTPKGMECSHRDEFICTLVGESAFWDVCLSLFVSFGLVVI